MPKVNVLNIKGENVGEIELNETLFNTEISEHAVYEVVKNQLANKRQGTQSAKTRAEVRGGGRKPWRQKGTGRARQGTIRAPQWRGGGIVFGPTPRSYSYKMPKKMRRLALRSALSFKVQENGFTVVDSFGFDAPKTKEFKNVLTTLEQPKKVLVVTENEDVNVELSARNIPGVQVSTAQGLNVLDITSADSVIITESAAKKVEEVLG